MENHHKSAENILDQIVSYNPTQVERELALLKRELDAQNRLNDALKTRDVSTNIEEVANFLARNAAHIADQLLRCRELSDNLKKVVEENHQMEQQEESYRDLLISQEARQVATNLREIKRLKEEIGFFLLQNGIAFPAS